MKTILKTTLIIILLSFILTIFNLIIFKEIFFSKHIIFSFSIHPFDICKKYSSFWSVFKKTYLITLIFASLIISYYLYSIFLKIKSLFINKNHSTNKDSTLNFSETNSQFNLLVGTNENNDNVFIPLKGLFQNVLVTGTIGSGKTSSFLYPVLDQLLSYNYANPYLKPAFLILDVKGNFYTKVLDYAK